MEQQLKNGSFFVGCNYWASHAGTHMWSDWRPDVVEDDLRRLAENRITALRLFPLWPVFQPIHMLYAGGGVPREYRFGEEPLPDTEAGRHGMSESAMSHFEEFCALAEKYGLKLIVGLITGWMSGRLFVPPALEGRNVLTDSEAIMWETRFVRYFVGRTKSSSAILAWDLGNERNCMAPVSSAEEFYVWTSNITGAIRSCDQSRPVISGMHSLLPDNFHTIQHQAELTDFLTTHPYPYFTPHCDMDPLNTVRTELHATAESLFYRGIGGKPCFVEEAGTLGPMFADEERAADFIRANCFSLWAHNCLGLMWWCANEQVELTHAPYDWNSVERELGLFRADKSPKPVLHTLKSFSDTLEKLNISSLPDRITDGVCILTRGQDTWAAAYMSFILGKKAGLDLRFSYSDQPLPAAPLYLLPSISGDSMMTAARFRELLNRVKEGAVLYLSLESGLLSPFTAYSGVKVISRRKTGCAEAFTLEYGGQTETLSLYTAFRLALEPADARVLMKDSKGEPVYTVHSYGKGKVFFLAAPLETALTRVEDAFSKNYGALYAPVRDAVESGKVAALKTTANAFLTEHILDESTRLLVLINYDPTPAQTQLCLKPGWSVEHFLLGSQNLGKNDAAVALIHKK